MNKYLSKEALTPHGATANVHRIHGIEIGDPCHVTVNSYANEDVERVLWQDTLQMPAEALSGEGDPRHLALVWLSEMIGGGVIVDGPSDIDVERAKRLQRADDMRDFHIAKGTNTASGRVDTDQRSITNVMALYQKATRSKMEGTPFQVTFKFADNVERQVGIEDILAMGDAVLFHVDACYARYWQIKDQIKAAGDIETMEAILVDGWPV